VLRYPAERHAAVRRDVMEQLALVLAQVRIVGAV
jgi:hypothetical protein